MTTINVRFQNRFILPGFGRKRFQSFKDGGICKVPEELRNSLPKSAEIIKDYVDAEDTLRAEESLKAADFARQATDTSHEALKQAGLHGLVDEDAEDGGDDEDDPLEFGGKKYKSMAAKKAAMTREGKK